MSESNYDYYEQYDDEVDDQRNAPPPARGRSSTRTAVPSRSRRAQPRSEPAIVRRAEQPVHSEYFSLKKSALVEMVPLAGQVWASFLGRPQMPAAVGDDIADRENAALHRDALARHQQMQHRIVALSDLAARALDMVLD